MKLAISIATLSIMISSACRQAYVPPVVSSKTPYLVMEGFINNGSDSTYITVTHTFSLDDTASVTPELHARLTIEGKDNSSYLLTEWGHGQYGLPSLSLNNAVQYRLHVRTAANKEYVSDYVPLKPSPTIDSISWERTSAGVVIYTNTHDPQTASQYYKWDYMQTWEFHSVYFALLDYDKVNHKIIPLNPNPFFVCWKYANNSNVLVTSTTQLTRDEVYKFPLVLIPANSWMLGIRYSILVKQYAITKDAYNYWQNLQKNTEQIGSIFSPQPSATTTNVHAVSDPAEQVIGYISGGTLQKQRIFITPEQVPNWVAGTYQFCFIDSIPPGDVDQYLRFGEYRLIDSWISPVRGLLYDVSSAPCVDCTLVGTNVKPTFW